MIGKNVTELILPAHLSGLHLVFNVSLLMPFAADKDMIPPKSVVPKDNFLQDFIQWAPVTYVLDYWKLPGDIHEYLIRDDDCSGLDDKCKLLTTISPNLDIFLQEFHRKTLLEVIGPPLSV